MLLRAMRCAFHLASTRLTSALRMTETLPYYHLGLATQYQQLGKSLNERHFCSYDSLSHPSGPCAVAFRIIWRNVLELFGVVSAFRRNREPDSSRHDYGGYSRAELNIYPYSRSNSRFSRRDACPSTSVVRTQRYAPIDPPTSTTSTRSLPVRMNRPIDREHEPGAGSDRMTG